MGKLHALIIQVDSSTSPKSEQHSKIVEAKQLIDTYGAKVVAEIHQYRNQPDRSYFIGQGKIEDIKQLCKDNNVDIVIFNDLLKPGQLFRVEKELWKVNPHMRVWDRFDLILEIFDLHAHTTEAKLQIKLARAKHLGPRIYGLGASELSRQGGGVGTRGKGETNIEFERRNIKKEVQTIEKKLKKIQQQKKKRLNQRKEKGIGPVALVGYTSAGKTTLFNALTGKKKEMNKQLFTTLDTVVGKMKSELFDLPILVSDTIGFINHLPHDLLDSFKSTLLESVQAELVLHVVDMSDPEFETKIDTVNQILNDLQIKQPVVVVGNQIDAIPEELINERVSFFKKYQHVFISALKNEGVQELKAVIESYFIKTQ